jgi:hypothetical protein
LHRYREVLFSSLYEALLFSAGSGAVAVVIFLALGVPVQDVYGLILLIVSAGLMMVGGAMSFVGPGTSKVIATLLGTKDKTDKRDFAHASHMAALYSTTGVLLFAESLLLAFVFAA